MPFLICLLYTSNLEFKTNVCEYPGIEQKTIEMVFSAGMQERVILSSFNHYTLLRCKKIAPQILCGALEEDVYKRQAMMWRKLGLCGTPFFRFVESVVVRKIKQLP